MLKTANKSSASGFSLLEMLVAITVTLIIMGSVYGLIAQGQNAFGREPLVADRQQQIRLAMDRIQKDVVSAGLGLGPYNQTFTPGLDAQGPIGVRVAADPALGGGNSDFLEIRSRAAECAQARTAASALPAPLPVLSGGNLQTLDPISACFDPNGWNQGFVFLLYPNGWSKLGWLSNMSAANASTFAAPQPEGSQIDPLAIAAHVQCSRWFGNTTSPASPNVGCPVLPAAAVPPVLPDETVGGCLQCDPFAIQAAEVIRYEIGTDTDGVIGLFRSTTGGFDATSGTPVATNPPGVAWQLVARGIEDMQVEYVSINSGVATFVNTPNFIADSNVTGPGDIVQGVRVTLWSRVVGDRAQPAGNPGDGLSGETRAAGNQVMAVRGSMTSTMAPRAAQEALNGTAKQWR
jgi:prepilin-type N-terminal cleavage/methylation domain-containing protein